MTTPIDEPRPADPAAADRITEFVFDEQVEPDSQYVCFEIAADPEPGSVHDISDSEATECGPLPSDLY
jgi:hypothetical protein